jgi:anti-anti-sigma factor
VPGDTPYELTVDPATNAVRVALRGEIDIAMNEHLRTLVDTSLADRPDSVEVDFSDVSFMDSTGIRFLVGYRTRCDAIGASWSLVGLSASIKRLIELSGLDDFLAASR